MPSFELILKYAEQVLNMGISWTRSLPYCFTICLYFRKSNILIRQDFHISYYFSRRKFGDLLTKNTSKSLSGQIQAILWQESYMIRKKSKDWQIKHLFSRFFNGVSSVNLLDQNSEFQSITFDKSLLFYSKMTYKVKS